MRWRLSRSLVRVVLGAGVARAEDDEVREGAVSVVFQVPGERAT